MIGLSREVVIWTVISRLIKICDQKVKSLFWLLETYFSHELLCGERNQLERILCYYKKLRIRPISHFGIDEVT